MRTVELADARVGPALVAKRAAGASISVCLPCRDEASTIGAIVDAIRHTLVDAGGFVDELLVIDDHSRDSTADVAAAAGATVVAVDDIRPELGTGTGKGNALWASIAASRGDIIVWCDGDLREFDPTWVIRLALPLLTDPSVALVKASYQRPTDHRGAGGGRTTELVARPLLSLFFPELAGLRQPLSGETAGRRSLLERLPIAQGWGVEVALLIDIARELGAEAIAQVDLGVRHHRHRSLSDLAVQAAEITTTILGRARPALLDDVEHVLRSPSGSQTELNTAWRPPVRASRAEHSEPTQARARHSARSRSGGRPRSM